MSAVTERSVSFLLTQPVRGEEADEPMSDAVPSSNPQSAKYNFFWENLSLCKILASFLTVKNCCDILEFFHRGRVSPSSLGTLIKDHTYADCADAALLRKIFYSSSPAHPPLHALIKAHLPKLVTFNFVDLSRDYETDPFTLPENPYDALIIYNNRDYLGKLPIEQIRRIIAALTRNAAFIKLLNGSARSIDKLKATLFKGAFKRLQKHDQPNLALHMHMGETAIRDESLRNDVLKLDKPSLRPTASG